MNREQIIEATKQFKEGIEIDHPQLVCWPLSSYLRTLGIVCDTLDVDVVPEDDPFLYPHCVIVFPNGEVLDACADNFEKPIAIYDKMPDNYTPTKKNTPNPFY